MPINPPGPWRHSSNVPSSPPVTATVWSPSCPTVTARTPNVPPWPGCGSPAGVSPSSLRCGPG